MSTVQFFCVFLLSVAPVSPIISASLKTDLQNFKIQACNLQGKINDLQSSLQEKLGNLHQAIKFIGGAAKIGNKIFASQGIQVPYQDAETNCANAGGQLASPQNDTENDAIASFCNKYNLHGWLGINDKQTQGTFKYLNGQDVTYSQWSVGQPEDHKGEDCVEILDTGKWNDCICTDNRLVICEF